MFDAISEDAQRKSLGRRDGFFFCGPICQYTRHVYNLGNPAPVGLEFCFDFIHYVRHICILARSYSRGIKGSTSPRSPAASSLVLETALPFLSV